MNKTDLWTLLPATIFLEMLKDFVKESLSSRRNLKNKRDEKRDEKRLDIYEEIYSKLNEMSKLSSINEDIEINISQLETILREKNLYIEPKIEKIVRYCCDYFQKVINRDINRDISKSQSFLSDFKKAFNK